MNSSAFLKIALPMAFSKKGIWVLYKKVRIRIDLKCHIKSNYFRRKTSFRGGNNFSACICIIRLYYLELVLQSRALITQLLSAIFFPINLMDFASPSTKFQILLEKLKKTAAGFELTTIRSTDERANHYTTATC